MALHQQGEEGKEEMNFEVFGIGLLMIFFATTKLIVTFQKDRLLKKWGIKK